MGRKKYIFILWLLALFFSIYPGCVEKFIKEEPDVEETVTPSPAISLKRGVDEYVETIPEGSGTTLIEGKFLLYSDYCGKKQEKGSPPPQPGRRIRSIKIYSPDKQWYVQKETGFHTKLKTFHGKTPVRWYKVFLLNSSSRQEKEIFNTINMASVNDDVSRGLEFLDWSPDSKKFAMVGYYSGYVEPLPPPSLWVYDLEAEKLYETTIPVKDVIPEILGWFQGKVLYRAYTGTQEGREQYRYFTWNPQGDEIMRLQQEPPAEIPHYAMVKKGDDDYYLKGTFPDEKISDSEGNDSTTADSGNPADMVKNYYNSINDKELKKAWEIRSKRHRKEQPYDKFQANWSNNVKITISKVKVVSNDKKKAKVSFSLSSVDTNQQGKEQKGNYNGTAWVIMEDGAWRVDKIDIF